MTEPRLVRRVIQQHLLGRGYVVPGFVPHAHCYGLQRSELETLVTEGELSLSLSSSSEEVILVSRPATEKTPFRGQALDTQQRHPSGLVRRAELHGLIHLLLEARARRGLFDGETVRTRIDQLGRTEFEEIRSTLEHDDLLLPPAGDLEVYIEFAALFLELSQFAPDLLVTTFPGLEDHDDVLDVLAQDLDLDQLLDRSPKSSFPSSRPALPPREAAEARPVVTEKVGMRLLRRARRARQRKDDDRALLACGLATLCEQPSTRQRASQELRQDAERFAARLARAQWSPPQAVSWMDVLERLALTAARQPRPWSGAESGVLRALRKAINSFETPGFIVDVPSWILSWGKRPALRRREAAHLLAVARHVEVAYEQTEGVRLKKQHRMELHALLRTARDGARQQVRLTLGRRVTNTLRQVGLRPRSGPEMQARDHLVEELLDRVLERGFLSLSQLRDSISQHELKLPDLSQTTDLLRGDPLLLADEGLSRQLDGIHRRGDVYLRWLQKLSSLPFGTSLGRVLALWLLLPALGAFTIVEGFVLIFGPVAQWLGASGWQFNWPAFGVTALAIVGLLHSEWLRIAFRLLLDAMGWLLSLVFLKLPRALLGGVFFQRLLRHPNFRAFVRMLAVPAGLASVTYWATPVGADETLLRWGATVSTFVVVAFVMGSRLGYWLEDFYLENVAPAWSTLSRQWIPSLLRAVGRTFSAAMAALEDASHRIGDALRFRQSASVLGVVFAGGAGLVWAVVAYLVRLYVTLLVEPEVNPLKHFPVVTVAHKLMLPFLPDLLVALERPLAILGPILGGAIAGVTVFLLPSVFGFLAWELKANYRLYRATRARFVEPTRFGPHGETCRELLVEGLHSGTIPKLYARLRRAAERQVERRARYGGEPSPLARSNVGRFHRKLHEVERSIRHLVERELLPPLRAATGFPFPELELRRIDISSNRLRIQLAQEREPSVALLELTIEQLGGRLVASLSRKALLEELSKEQLVIFENVLAVFYHRAQIDLVREQLEEELQSHPALEGIGAASWDYEVQEQGLVVRLEDDELEFVFDLDTYFRKKLKPKVVRARAKKKLGQLPRLDSSRILYQQQRVAFEEWERAWHAASEPDVELPRLLLGARLLGRPESPGQRTALDAGNGP